MNQKIRGVMLILLLIFSSIPAYSSFLDNPILDEPLLGEQVVDLSQNDNNRDDSKDNKITGFAFFDSIGNFFKNLFKKESVGTIIEHDEDYDGLKIQCPDPKCLVNTDKGYQCMDSGDGFFNFRDEQSNVCLNGQL